MQGCIHRPVGLPIFHLAKPAATESIVSGDRLSGVVLIPYSWLIFAIAHFYGTLVTDAACYTGTGVGWRIDHQGCVWHGRILIGVSAHGLESAVRRVKEPNGTVCRVSGPHDCQTVE